MGNSENTNFSNCVKCNCELQEGAMFCPECGTKVEIPTTTTPPVTESGSQGHKFCNKCGEKNDANAMACTSCGNVFSKSANEADKLQNPLSNLQNIKLPSEIKLPNEIKMPKNVNFKKPMFIAVPIVLVLVVIGFAVYNSLVSNRLDYVLLTTQKQLASATTDTYESFDFVENINALLRDSYDMTVDLEYATINVEMEKNKNTYTYVINSPEADEEVVVEYTLKDNSLEGTVDINEEQTVVTFDLKYDKGSDELEAFITGEDYFTGYGDATVIIQEPALKIIDGKIIVTDDFVEIKNEYTDSLVELLLESEVSNESSKSKEFDREITLEIRTDDYTDIVFDYYEACADVLLQNIKNVEITTEDSYVEGFSEEIVDELEYSIDSMLEELEYNMTPPSDEYEIILKTENSKIKAIEADGFELAFENTDNYLNNTLTFEYYGDDMYNFEGTVIYNFDSKTWVAEVDLSDEDGYDTKMDFSYELKNGKGEFNSEVYGYSQNFDFILYSDKKSAEIGINNEYGGFNVEINAK